MYDVSDLPPGAATDGNYNYHRFQRIFTVGESGVSAAAWKYLGQWNHIAPHAKTYVISAYLRIGAGDVPLESALTSAGTWSDNDKEFTVKPTENILDGAVYDDKDLPAVADRGSQYDYWEFQRYWIEGETSADADEWSLIGKVDQDAAASGGGAVVATDVAPEDGNVITLTEAQMTTHSNGTLFFMTREYSATRGEHHPISIPVAVLAVMDLPDTVSDVAADMSARSGCGAADALNGEWRTGRLTASGGGFTYAYLIGYRRKNNGKCRRVSRLFSEQRGHQSLHRAPSRRATGADGAEPRHCAGRRTGADCRIVFGLHAKPLLHEAAALKWQHDMGSRFLGGLARRQPQQVERGFCRRTNRQRLRALRLREFGSVMSEERLQIISDWLVANRNSNQFSQDPNLPALRNALLDGKITNVGRRRHSQSRRIWNAPRMMTKARTTDVQFASAPLGTPLIIGFTEMGASEQQDENNTTMLIVDTPARKTIGDKRVEYAHQNEWLYNRTGLSTDEGRFADGHTGVPNPRRQCRNNIPRGFQCRSRPRTPRRHSRRTGFTLFRLEA